MSYKFIQANPLQEALEKMNRELLINNGKLSLSRVKRYLSSAKELKLIDEELYERLGMCLSKYSDQSENKFTSVFGCSI